MKNFSTLLLSLLATNALVGCIGDNTEPADLEVPDSQPTVIPFPRSCAEVRQSHSWANDGPHTLFVDHDQAKSWLAYCVDMDSSPKDYLTLPKGGDMNFSRYSAGGRSPGTEVETKYDKVRIDPLTLKLDISDQTFAVSTGSLMHLGVTEVTSMPLGVAMSCGGGGASANVSTEGTSFLIVDKFATAGDVGHAGSAFVWWTNQNEEMWADGDCGWVGPELVPANPMNNAGTFLIQLSYN
jgi:GON domain